MNIQIDRDMDKRRLISIVYPFMIIYVSRISIVECPCMDIPVWISMWIDIFMDN